MFAAMRGRHTISRAGTARVALVIDACSVPWELQLCRGSEPAHVANLTRSGQPPRLSDGGRRLMALRCPQEREDGEDAAGPTTLHWPGPAQPNLPDPTGP